VLTRRVFNALFAGTLTAPELSWGYGRAADRNGVLYSGVGRELTRYEINVASATLVRKESVALESNIQYAWRHPSRRFLYVSSSNAGPGHDGGDHCVAAFRIAASGVLEAHGEPVPLRWRPIHNSVDRSGDYLLVAYPQPSGLSVHRINSDGTIGEEVRQPEGLDCGVYGHQIRATPSNRSVILVTRGNDPTTTRPEDPGALKVYRFENGVLANQSSIQPGNGRGFGPRHVDFHPTRPWVYVSVERENQLHVYELQTDGGLSPAPLFVKDTLNEPDRRVSTAGPIHVHPSGRFVYVANRGGWSAARNPAAEMYQGLPVYDATDSSIAVFSINSRTGEPNLIQIADSHGAHPRTFSLDLNGRILVLASLVPIALRKGGGVSVLPAGLSVFRTGSDGLLHHVRTYDVETGRATQWWSGLVSLA
jgi:6-phosphogluconolactonase